MTRDTASGSVRLRCALLLRRLSSAPDFRARLQVVDISEITRPGLGGKPKRSTGTSVSGERLAGGPPPGAFTDALRARAQGIDLSNVQKFGTQAEKAKSIHVRTAPPPASRRRAGRALGEDALTGSRAASTTQVFSNGDPNSKGVKVLLSKKINAWDKVRAALFVPPHPRS